MTTKGAGSEQPDNGTRAERVRTMFGAIAPTYDLLNGVLSLGIDQRWRQEAAARALLGVPSGGAVLDVATGTGDLAFSLKKARPDVAVTGVDFALPMLERARLKAERKGLDVTFMPGDGTDLPWEAGSFDAVTIAYGLRNFVDLDAGLREFRRVLKPGGRLVVLEFPPPPEGMLGRLFRYYFTRLLPRIGGLVSRSPGAYEYLPESVINFLGPDELSDHLSSAGFVGVEYRLQTFGVSALHHGTAGAEGGGR